MWSTIFCAMANVWFLHGAVVKVDLLFLLGVVATGFTFCSARSTGTSPRRPDVESSES